MMEDYCRGGSDLLHPLKFLQLSHVFGYFYEYLLKSIILLVLSYAFHHVTYVVTFHNREQFELISVPFICNFVPN